MCTLQAKVAPVWLFLPVAECNPGHPVWSRACRRPAVCASLNFFMTTWKHISKLHLKVRNVCEVIKKIMTIQCLIHICSQTESISLFWGKLLIIPATTAGSCWGHIWLQRRPSLFYLLFLSACDAASSSLRAQTTWSRFGLVIRVNHRSTFTPSEGFLLFGGMIHCWVESVQPFNQSEWKFFFWSPDRKRLLCLIDLDSDVWDVSRHPERADIRTSCSLSIGSHSAKCQCFNGSL